METSEITYPIPLSNGFWATIKLPAKLTKADADKISKVVTALAENKEVSDEPRF